MSGIEAARSEMDRHERPWNHLPEIIDAYLEREGSPVKWCKTHKEVSVEKCWSGLLGWDPEDRECQVEDAVLIVRSDAENPSVVLGDEQ